MWLGGGKCLLCMEVKRERIGWMGIMVRIGMALLNGQAKSGILVGKTSQSHIQYTILQVMKRWPER